MAHISSFLQASEAELRVAFIYNFFKFIQWPHTPGHQLNLCVLGGEEGEVRAALDQLAHKKVNEQEINLLYLSDASSIDAQLSGCQMLYRPVSDHPLALPHPLPVGVLLVADEPEPQLQDVSIALRRNADGRIEFAIDKSVVDRAGIIISSQLLKLAKPYQGGGD